MTTSQERKRLVARRLAAHLLDLADEPIFVVWTLWWIEPTKSGLRLFLAIAWIAWVVWQLAAQGSSGQSLGKRFMAIQVVSDTDGAPIGFRRTLVRWLLHGLDTLTVIGWIAAVTTNRSLADRVMKSAVTSV